MCFFSQGSYPTLSACYDQKLEKKLDKGGLGGAILTDFSKSFHCFEQDLLIARPAACDFDLQSLNSIFSYLFGRSRETKINHGYSNYKEIIIEVSQSSITVLYLQMLHTSYVYFLPMST